MPLHLVPALPTCPKTGAHYTSESSEVIVYFAQGCKSVAPVAWFESGSSASMLSAQPLTHDIFMLTAVTEAHSLDLSHNEIQLTPVKATL